MEPFDLSATIERLKELEPGRRVEALAEIVARLEQELEAAEAPAQTSSESPEE